MAINVTMPALGTVSDETKVIEWLVKEGEEVKKGQALFTAESDKATQEVEALASGVIAEIITPPGSMAKTGFSSSAIATNVLKTRLSKD